MLHVTEEKVTQIKIIDFGFSTALAFTREYVQDQLGQIYFMAPEVLENNKHSNLGDIFALGATIFYCLNGKLPLETRSGIGSRLKYFKDNADLKFSDLLNYKELIPNILIQILDKTMRANSADRYRIGQLI